MANLLTYLLYNLGHNPNKHHNFSAPTSARCHLLMEEPTARRGARHEVSEIGKGMRTANFVAKIDCCILNCSKYAADGGAIWRMKRDMVQSKKTV